MSLRKINKALSLHLHELSEPTAYENAPFNPDTAGLYLSETILPISTDGVGLEYGSTDNHSGIYQVMVNAPRETHKTQAQATADDVTAHFKRGTVVTSEGVTVRVERAYASPALYEGDRYRVPVSIEYRALIK